MKKHSKSKRLLSSILCLSLVLPGVTVPAGKVQAEEAQTIKTITGLGAGMIADPVKPAQDSDAWKGSFVYFGKYGSSPVKYRVLDAGTTDYSVADAEGNKTETMLLDCDTILYYQKFDEDAIANETGKNANDWSISDAKASLNGTDFLDNEDVFTSMEKNAIAKSIRAGHVLTTDSETGVNVSEFTKQAFENYIALDGEKVFLLDAEDVSNPAYGYSMSDGVVENRKKAGSAYAYWWLRSACTKSDKWAATIFNTGDIINSRGVNDECRGVSPALNVDLSSVLFSSVISGTAGEAGAEYKLTLLDDAMSITLGRGVTKSGNTVTIPYSISGDHSGSATQVSVLVLDKEYSAGNANGAEILDYQKLDVDNFSASGTGTYTLPETLSGKEAGADYHIYILAEDVNGEKETDYAGKPVEIHLWKAPTVKKMNFGTKNIIDPAVPNGAEDAWQGCYVWYGNYDADRDEVAEPVKYRVLDAAATDYREAETTDTMLLDCDSILYDRKFDEDGTANEDGKKANDWFGSDVKKGLNGEDFLNKEGVFTREEKSAIAGSTKANHELTTDSVTGVNVEKSTKSAFADYVALNGEKIFLLDAEDVSNGAYGYSRTDKSAENRKKTGNSSACWWLRSAGVSSDKNAGSISSDGDIVNTAYVNSDNLGVSPALNLNLTSVLFSSASEMNKSLALTADSEKIGTTTETDWKLTLKDTGKAVALTKGRRVTKASDGTITVPYTYTDKAETESEKVNQISVMITDKVYDTSKKASEQETQILYYGALGNIRNTEGEESTVAGSTTGIGTFSLPGSLTGTMGEDYYIYLLAEHVNTTERRNTDYASEPMQVTAILEEINTVAIPGIDVPIPEKAFVTEADVTSTGVKETAALTWKKVSSEAATEVTGNAEWKTTYEAYMTLTAAEGYAFTDFTGVTGKAGANGISNAGGAFAPEEITLNEDGTLTVTLGKYTSAARKMAEVIAPEMPAQFTSYYTKDNVLTSTELGTTAKVILEGTTLPNPVDMEVEWSLANEDDAAYNAAPLAVNTFKWTVTPDEYAEYDVNDMVLSGTVTIQNKDYTPVTISGSDVEITYDGSDILDVSSYFTIDENAGTPTYELLDTSTGNGTLAGSNLTMTTLGTFVVKVSTGIHEVYNKGEHTLTITVKKANPKVMELPTVKDRTYHPAVALADDDLQGGTVKDVKSGKLAGTWNWKETGVVATRDNNGYVAVFTPEDTVHYDKVEETISVKVEKAVPYIMKAPSAGAITYGESLSSSVLSGGVVSYSKDDNTIIDGTWSWKEADTKPAVADSGTTQYDVVFTPTEANNYNMAESKITLIVYKANKPESAETTADIINAMPEKRTPLGTLAAGTKGISDDGTAAYKITISDLVKGTVTYVAPTDKKAATISIPDAVVIDGVTYKVTAIEKNAFKKNVYVKKVIIGKNVSKIASKAFYGCKKLKTLIIKSKKLTIKKTGSKAFAKTYKRMTVKVPKKKFKAYKTMLIKRGVNKKAKFKKF